MAIGPRLSGRGALRFHRLSRAQTPFGFGRGR